MSSLTKIHRLRVNAVEFYKHGYSCEEGQVAIGEIEDGCDGNCSTPEPIDFVVNGESVVVVQDC